MGIAIDAILHDHLSPEDSGRSAWDVSRLFQHRFPISEDVAACVLGDNAANRLRFRLPHPSGLAAKAFVLLSTPFDARTEIRTPRENAGCGITLIARIS
jgi:hypothetical protein